MPSTFVLSVRRRPVVADRVSIPGRPKPCGSPASAAAMMSVKLAAAFSNSRAAASWLKRNRNFSSGNARCGLPSASSQRICGVQLIATTRSQGTRCSSTDEATVITPTAPRSTSELHLRSLHE
jgi:hypothetical protein